MSDIGSGQCSGVTLQLLSAAGFEATCRLQTFTSRRRITQRQFEHWFSAGGDKFKTFAWYLRRKLEDEELSETHKLFERQLVNKDVGWKMTYAIIAAATEGNSP